MKRPHGYQVTMPKAREPEVWTAADDAALTNLMRATYALTKPERRRLKNLLDKAKRCK